MRKKIKQYTAVLLPVTMSLPGTMAYGNVDSLDAASGVVDASGYLKASTSNANKPFISLPHLTQMKMKKN